MADKDSKLQRALAKRKIKKEYHDIMASDVGDYGYAPIDRSKLKSEYEDYLMDRDSLEAEERKERRKIKGRKKMIESVAKAADALGKIGAARSGGIVTGDLVPDLALGDSEEQALAEKYDDKRLEMLKKKRELKELEESLDVSDKEAMALAKAKRKEEIARLRKEQEELAKEAAIESLEEKERKEVFKYRSKARKDIERFSEDIIEGIEDETLQGEDVMQMFEEEGVPEEIIAPFKETLGFFEDEEKQVKTIEDLKSQLITHLISKRIKSDLADGKEVNPRIMEALGLTTPAKAVKMSPTTTEKSVEGQEEVKTFQYKVVAPSGAYKYLSLTAEQAEDLRDKGANIQRLKQDQD